MHSTKKQSYCADSILEFKDLSACGINLLFMRDIFATFSSIICECMVEVVTKCFCFDCFTKCTFRQNKVIFVSLALGDG